jgi:hypothetical protein
MRSACLAWLALSLVGCGTVVDRTPFRADADLAATSPRELAEAGHSSVISPPAGVRFALELDAVRETPRQGIPSQHYELLLTVTNAGDVPWAADLDRIELVDDQGATLKPAEVLRRTAEAKTPGTTSHLLIFDLPLSYEPRHIARVVVHWALVASGQTPIRIASRFRN